MDKRRTRDAGVEVEIEEVKTEGGEIAEAAESWKVFIFLWITSAIGRQNKRHCNSVESGSLASTLIP